MNRPSVSSPSARSNGRPDTATRPPPACTTVWSHTRRVAHKMVTRQRLTELSPEACVLLGQFGLGSAVRKELLIMVEQDELRLDHPGVVLVTGPSGCGKSQLLQAIVQGERHQQPSVPPADRSKPLVDWWPTLPIAERVKMLSTAGLADPYTWARVYDELSVGQRARADLIDRIYAGGRVVVVDEFLTGLDRPTARACAWAIARVVRARSQVLVAATSEDDIAEDLLADVIIRVGWDEQPDYERPAWSRAACTLHDDLYYEPGVIGDWQRVRPLHYAAGDPATYHSVHVLRHPDIRTPVAVAVLSYPPMQSAARNLATGDEYRGRSLRETANRLNREVLQLSRVVVVPELRCAGVGQRLLDEVISRTTARYIECSTQMGRYNKFLERSGFREVPQTSSAQEAAWQAWAIEHQVPPTSVLDPDALAAWCSGRSVRVAREARRLVWHLYHQMVYHRRTGKKHPRKVPGWKSKHWPEAWRLAAARLRDRPTYWIAGPLNDQVDSPGRSKDREYQAPTQPDPAGVRML